MLDLLGELHNRTPNLIVNRGLGFFDDAKNPQFASAYKSLFWALMFEDFATEWNKGEGQLYSQEHIDAVVKEWPQELGEHVLVVDFANCQQLADLKGELVTTQRAAVKKANPAWLNYIGDIEFHETRYGFKCDPVPLKSGKH